jgi:hypothetical protein
LGKIDDGREKLEKIMKDVKEMRSLAEKKRKEKCVIESHTTPCKQGAHAY